jgi:endonuclease-3
MDKMGRIIGILSKRYGTKIRKGKPFDVLIGTVLSQRTKDEVSEPAARRLLARASSPKKMLGLSSEEIGRLILPTNYYIQKSKRIKEISRILLKRYGGRVPRDMAGLDELPGVGPKTASIVLAYSFGIPRIAVDTHVNRISQRLGLVPKNTKPETTQKILEGMVLQKYKIIMNNLLVDFGKDICRPLAPHCFRCPIFGQCRYEKRFFYKSRHI